MRHPAFRLRKYDAKLSGDVIKARIDAHRDSMVEQEEAIFGEISLVEAKAKVVCEAAGIPSVAIPGYLNFARQCYAISKKFSSVTRQNLVQIRFNDWVAQGLVPSVLAECATLCGTAIPGY